VGEVIIPDMNEEGGHQIGAHPLLFPNKGRNPWNFPQIRPNENEKVKKQKRFTVCDE
jgi:hypothetical protein